MFEVVIVLVGVLAAITICATGEYYKQLKRVKAEYEKAQEIIGDIVLSFKREFQLERNKIDVAGYKIEALSSKIDRVLKKVEDLEKEAPEVKGKLEGFLRDKEAILERLGDVEKGLEETVASQNSVIARISTLEEQTQRGQLTPEVKLDTVIPIRRDKALAPLTETELAVLEMLSNEGPKTAPEIKEKVKLSREHTARLMKKLYEEGYLERDASKIPFKYSIKKEMEKLLKKTENEAL